MKKLFVIVLLLVLPILGADKTKKFNTTITLNFKGLSLEEITELEKKLLSNFSDTLDYSINITAPRTNPFIIQGSIICDSLVLPNNRSPFGQYRDNKLPYLGN
jgi:hypothetical protein